MQITQSLKVKKNDSGNVRNTKSLPRQNKAMQIGKQTKRDKEDNPRHENGNGQKNYSKQQTESFLWW